MNFDCFSGQKIVAFLTLMGPFKYYVNKIVGGWGWPNAYVCLHGGWVGVERYLRNQKNQFFYQCSEKGWTNSKILVRTYTVKKNGS